MHRNSDAYHPVDCGFEISFYKSSNLTPRLAKEIVYYVLKEDQDIEQSYLEQAAKTLREDFVLYIRGEKWFDKRNSRQREF